MRCEFPQCPKQAADTWALVPLCTEHHDEIKNENLKYYNKKISGDERENFRKIIHLLPWNGEGAANAIRRN